MLALSVGLAVALFAVLAATLMIIVEPKPIPGFDAAQRQSAETALYMVAFAIVLPFSLFGGSRLTRTIAGGPNSAALSPLTALLTATLAAAFVAARLSAPLLPGAEMSAVLCGVGLWAVGAVALLGRASSASGLLLKLTGTGSRAWTVAAAAIAAALLTVTDLNSISPYALAGSALVVPAFLVWERRRCVPRLPPRWGVVADVLAVVVLLLVIPDLVIIRPEDPALTPMERYDIDVVQFHHNFLLGPANQVLGGSTMLVDTASQYGVGSIYFLAGAFSLAPIGYGTLGLIDGILTALYFAGGYCLLRVAHVSRTLAASALALGVITLVLNRLYPVGALPQEGPLRFGLPLAVVLAIVAGERWQQHSRLAHGASFAVLALSSVWAAEAFAFTGATFAVLMASCAYLGVTGTRLRWLGRRVALAAVACIVAHLLLAGATLAGTGQLPDWGQYLGYLDAFVFGGLGELTYDVSRWSPGLAVGLAYLVSAMALALVVRDHPAVVQRERVALLALSGTTAYGIVLLSYFVDRSGDHVLAYMSLPALLSGALWLGLLLRSQLGADRVVRTGALAFALTVSVLLISVAWSSVGPRLGHSALAQAWPGGSSTGTALDRLLHFPPLNANVPEGERLLNRYMPGERRTPVLLPPEPAIEILMRSGRANQFELSDPLQDAFTGSQGILILREAVAQLEPGRRVLLDGALLDALAAVDPDPSLDLLSEPGSPPASLLLRVLERIDDRFRLRPIYRGGDGLVVVELATRR